MCMQMDALVASSQSLPFLLKFVARKFIKKGESCRGNINTISSIKSEKMLILDWGLPTFVQHPHLLGRAPVPVVWCAWCDRVCSGWWSPAWPPEVWAARTGSKRCPSDCRWSSKAPPEVLETVWEEFRVHLRPLLRLFYIVQFICSYFRPK